MSCGPHFLLHAVQGLVQKVDGIQCLGPEGSQQGETGEATVQGRQTPW